MIVLAGLGRNAGAGKNRLEIMTERERERDPCAQAWDLALLCVDLRRAHDLSATAFAPNYAVRCMCTLCFERFL